MVSWLWDRRIGSISGSAHGTWQSRDARPGWCWVAFSIWSVVLDLLLAHELPDTVFPAIFYLRTFFEILLHTHLYRVRFHKQTYDSQKVHFGGQSDSSFNSFYFKFICYTCLFCWTAITKFSGSSIPPCRYLCHSEPVVKMWRTGSTSHQTVSAEKGCACHKSTVVALFSPTFHNWNHDKKT